MANLTKTNWSKGWIPSQDDTNGDPDGLLRMDNLRQNEQGVLTLVKGAQKLNGSAFSDYVSKVFSKVISGVEYIWVALNDSTTDVRRSANNFGSSSSILTNGGGITCFGDALGQVLICAGSKRKKDNGTTVTNLGITTPLAAPSINPQLPPQLDLDPPNGPGVYNPYEGHDSFTSGLSFYIFTDPVTLRGGITLDFPGVTDLFAIGAGRAADPSKDILHFVFQFDNNPFTQLHVQILLADSNGNFNGLNYYFVNFDVQNDPQFAQLGPTNPHISVSREQFTRVGDDATIDWSRCLGIYFSAEATADCRFGVGQTHMNGGATGVLNGYYQWAQIDVNDNGTYIAKSPLSPASEIELIQNGYATITPNTTTDPQVTHHWIYRRSVPSVEAVGVLQPSIPDLLNRWYRVAVTPVNIAVDDTLSDLDAIQNEDSTTIVNEFLQSLQDTDDIIGMEGLFNERMLYLTKDRILLSDRLNPDAVDTRYTIKAFGDPTERNLFLHKITNNQLLLATTKDLYEITGTLLDLPDGTIDAFVRAIGEQYPPLSADSALSDGKLFYTAADGIRVTVGSNSVNISSQLTLLFQAEDRHGIPYISVVANNAQVYPMTVGHGNLYTTLPLHDGSKRLLIYNFTANIYRLQVSAPRALWTTQTDRLLFGYDNADNYLREFESGSDIDGSSGQEMTLQTVYDSNGQPRNRKDTFTLKIVAQTGGVNVEVLLAKDKGSFTSLGNINSSTTTTFFFDISAYALGFRYALKLHATALKTFYLYEFTIEYEPRPEQLNYLRIPNSNMGSYARKRLTAYAFVVDTLGQDVTFTPFIDNASQATSTVNKATKLTYKHFFTSETIGTDIGGVLQSTSPGHPFEFYGLNNEETVSEKLPTPTRYLVIPANDYGNPNRKRHTSYKFQINTRGANVRFTPEIDGTTYTPATYNTSKKTTVEYFFDTTLDITGIDIGGVLESLTSLEFEFYGVIVPQQVEVLPPRLESLYTPNTNLGVAAPKRLRTLPIIIDTRGSDVTFTPVVDGINGSPSTLNSSRKQTLYHYFSTDVFCTDIAGIFTGTTPFEFYEFGKPENVEILPVPKKYDQLPPLRFDKVGKIFAFRVRLIATGSSIDYAIYSEAETTVPVYSGTPFYSGTLTTVPNVDDIYEIQLPKSVNADMCRLVLGPAAVFYRYDIQVKVADSGMETDSKWVAVG